MRNIIHLITCLLLFGATPQSLSAATSPVAIKHIDAHYDVFKDGIKVATMAEIYTGKPSGYRIESTTAATGLLARIKAEVIHTISEGVVSKKGLRPLTYSQDRKLDTERNVHADFDWKTGHITLTDRTGKHILPLLAGTQDRLSAMYQFTIAPPKGVAELSFNMTNGSKVDEYSYLVTPNQSVTVPLGTFKALYLASPTQPGKSKTEIWLATEQGYFPYKMTITEPDGGQFTQVLTKISFE